MVTATHSSAEPDAAPGGLVGALVRIPTFDALRYRQFRFLWLGQMGNALGTWMDQVARGWLMYQLTSSALDLGLVNAIRALPFLLLSPVAGAVADRYERKRLLILSQLIDGAFYGLMAGLIFSGLIEPWHVYATAVGTGIVSVFQQPARQAMVSEAVPRHALTNAIGLDSMVFNTSRTIAPALAGILIALFDTGVSYAGQAILYLLSVLWTREVRPSSRRTSAGRGGRGGASFLRSFGEGWRFIVGSEAVWVAMTIAWLAAFLAMPFGALLPAFARDILSVGSTGQGLLLTAMGVGALSSAVLIASLGNRLPKGMLMLGGAVGYGLTLVAFAVSPWFPLSLAVMVVVGISNVGCHALVRTVVQSHSPSELQGRVMAVFQINQALVFGGSLVAGVLASLWSPQWSVAVMGAACAVGAAAIFFAVPSARRVR